MALTQKVQEEMKTALREGRKEDLAAYRMLLADLQREAKESGAELTEEQEVAILKRERKKRLESAESFRDAGREELTLKEEHALAIIEGFLPQQLDEAALRALIDEAVAETGASSPKDMGKVMSFVMARGGAQVDGKLASRLAQERLST